MVRGTVQGEENSPSDIFHALDLTLCWLTSPRVAMIGSKRGMAKLLE